MNLKKQEKYQTKCNKQKKNNFRFNLYFDEKGETLNTIIERAFSNYCVSRQN